MEKVYESINESKRQLKHSESQDTVSFEYLNEIRQLKFRISTLERDNKNLELDLESSIRVQHELNIANKSNSTSNNGLFTKSPPKTNYHSKIASLNLDSLECSPTGKGKFITFSASPI
jgi:hypothetical protein